MVLEIVNSKKTFPFRSKLVLEGIKSKNNITFSITLAIGIHGKQEKPFPFYQRHYYKDHDIHTAAILLDSSSAQPRTVNKLRTEAYEPLHEVKRQGQGHVMITKNCLAMAKQ